MFALAHLGIGSKIVSPWTKELKLKWVFLGTLLPDLIDKPLYYGAVLITGQHGAGIGLISGTRTFGHTALFALTLAIIANFKQSKLFAALSLGVASHLLLDNLADHIFAIAPTQERLLALLWPWLGNRFPTYPFTGALQHLRKIFQPYLLGGEVVGALILGWDYWKKNHAPKKASASRGRGAYRTKRRK